MTQYLVFTGDTYYPAGGALDFIGVYDNPTQAALSVPRGKDWAHVAELTDTGLVIVAEWIDGTINFYPERMAHTRAATATEARGRRGQKAFSV